MFPVGDVSVPANTTLSSALSVLAFKIWLMKASNNPGKSEFVSHLIKAPEDVACIHFRHRRLGRSGSRR